MSVRRRRVITTTYDRYYQCDFCGDEIHQDKMIERLDKGTEKLLHFHINGCYDYVGMKEEDYTLYVTR